MLKPKKLKGIYMVTGLIIQYPGLKAQHFPQAHAVVEKGGLKHLVDQFGNWVQTIFSHRASIITPQEHFFSSFVKK